VTLSVNNKLLLISGAFLLLVFFALINEIYLVLSVPLILFILYSIFYQPTWAFFIIAFFVPLSVNTDEFFASPVALFIPTEPILITLMVIYFMVHLVQPVFEMRIFSHPIFLAYCVYLCWMFISALVSMDPMVSFKYLIAHCWLFFPVFIFSAQIFRDPKNVRVFFALLIGSMSVVAFYTLIIHAGYNFEEKPAHWVMSPFFKDHTSYGAILALLFPMIIGLMVSKKNDDFMHSLLYGVILLFLVALVFSYTRAAWLSLVGAFVIWLIIYFRIRFSTLLIVAFGGAFFFVVSYDNIIRSLEKNETDSSGDFGEHLTSVSNISTDASNLERLNRWDCAMTMYGKKPLTGWGPGTYQFFYAPFQRAENLTIISTYNADGGNAHSEYLGPLAETGFPGLILFAVVVIVMFYRGFRNYHYIEDKYLRRLYISALLGLSTYFMHGFLNNYLDTDKAAVPVWGIAGLIAAVDLYHSGKKKPL
jgi:putative inorganic carbon (hco3(-)) transporter